VKLALTVNGRLVEVDVPPLRRLLDVLREDLHLTGTKEGCGEGECGACTVEVNGELVNSCLVPICQMAGTAITTIEGVGKDHDLHPLQQTFIATGGAQCGICTPGMIMAAKVFLEKHHADLRSQADRLAIRTALAGNLCRCTGYEKIVDAVVQAIAGGRQ